MRRLQGHGATEVGSLLLHSCAPGEESAPVCLPSSSPPWPTEAGKEVSGMLEATTRAPELKENSSNIIHTIAWHRSPSSMSSLSYSAICDKAIDQIQQKKKCVQLRNQDAKGSELHCAEKTRTNVRDLFTRIWVSLQAAESISDRIQKLRDEELQPQLLELLHGFARTRKVMVDSDEAQRQIMFEVNSFTCQLMGNSATMPSGMPLSSWRSSLGTGGPAS